MLNDYKIVDVGSEVRIKAIVDSVVVGKDDKGNKIVKYNLVAKRADGAKFRLNGMIMADMIGDGLPALWDIPDDLLIEELHRRNLIQSTH